MTPVLVAPADDPKEATHRGISAEATVRGTTADACSQIRLRTVALTMCAPTLGIPGIPLLTL